MALAKRLYAIRVWHKDHMESNQPLVFHYTSFDEMNSVAFHLRRAGYVVEGIYDPPISLNSNASYAVETAKVFLD